MHSPLRPQTALPFRNRFPAERNLGFMPADRPIASAMILKILHHAPLNTAPFPGKSPVESVAGEDAPRTTATRVVGFGRWNKTGRNRFAPTPRARRRRSPPGVDETAMDFSMIRLRVARPKRSSVSAFHAGENSDQPGAAEIPLAKGAGAAVQICRKVGLRSRMEGGSKPAVFRKRANLYRSAFSSRYSFRAAAWQPFPRFPL